MIIGIGALALMFLVSNITLYVIISPTLLPGQEFGPDVIGEWMQQNMGTVSGFLKMLIPIHLAMLLLAIISAIISKVPLTERLGLVRSSIPIWQYIVFMLGGLGAAALSGWLFLAHISPADDQMALARVFTQLGGIDGAIIILYTATMATFSEELLFRGFVLRGLLQRWKPVFAVGLSSLLFVLIHPSPFFMLAVLPLSIFYGIVAWRTGSIWPAIVCHSFGNIALAILNRMYPEPTVAFFGELTLFPILVGVFGVIFLVYSIRILFRKEVA